MNEINILKILLFDSRFLNLIKDPKLFTIYCFVVRAIGALGGAACEIAIFVIVTWEFRDSLATISVSVFSIDFNPVLHATELYKTHRPA